ncbi:hypothetical protein [Streptomyces sp. NPDC055058]
MTAIVGIVHDGTVYLGGDSAGVAGYALTVRADHKVFRTGPYVLGFTSSFRMGQLLRYAFAPPAPDGGDLARFMATTFVDAVRDTLKAGGWLRKDSEQEEGGTFLVGVRGRLFRVAGDFQVGEAADGYDAVGCGDELALGALFATARLGLAPRDRLRCALSAAERFSAGVRRPFVYADTRS